MSRTVSVFTPENVEVRFELAGLGSRFLAAFIDYLVVGLIATLLVLAYLFVFTTLHGAGGAWTIGICILLVFTVDWCYFMGFEAGRSGQTWGKRVLGLRVMRDGGFPIDTRAVIIRNLLRAIDFLPMLYCIGTIAVFVNQENKRLGDLAAGTMVVHERPHAVSDTTSNSSFDAIAAPPGSVFSIEQLLAITDSDVMVLREYLKRVPRMSGAMRSGLGRELAEKLGHHTGGLVTVETLPALLAEWELYHNR